MNVKMDDCFQFGLGAFETISVVDGRPIFLDRKMLQDSWILACQQNGA